MKSSDKWARGISKEPSYLGYLIVGHLKGMRPSSTERGGLHAMTKKTYIPRDCLNIRVQEDRHSKTGTV